MSESLDETAERQRRQTQKTVKGLGALTVALVAALLGMFMLMQQVFPWMSLSNDDDIDVPKGPVHVVAKPSDVTRGGPTTAQTVLESVLGIEVPELATGGWEATSPATGVPSLSFGFGCDPRDGLAAVVSASRAWQKGSADVGTVEVFGLAYPAGGGAVAFADASDAVLACTAASRYDLDGLGVEAMQVSAGGVSAAVWRRGDVLMLAKVTSYGRAGSVESVRETAQRFDAALDSALTGTCLSQDATTTQAVRSPYVNRDGYQGNVVSETVRWEPPVGYTPPTPVDPDTLPAAPVVPEVGNLPQAPSPMITKGPTALPAPVSVPQAPAAVTISPKSKAEVPHTVSDPTGPGCGWAFTGQVAPKFDATSADAAYSVALNRAQRTMTRVWKAWEKAQAAYDIAYAGYVSDVDAYTAYAEQVQAVREVWDEVNQARAEYLAAMSEYEEAVKALVLWKVDRKAARAEYQAAVKACAAQPVPTPTPTPTPTPEPTPGATPTAPTAPTATETPKGPKTPTMVCPPVRPAILDQEPPTVPDAPVPAPEAQLPTQGTSGQ